VRLCNTSNAKIITKLTQLNYNNNLNNNLFFNLNLLSEYWTWCNTTCWRERWQFSNWTDRQRRGKTFNSTYWYILL